MQTSQIWWHAPEKGTTWLHWRSSFPPVGSGNVTLHDYPLQSSYPQLVGESDYGNNVLEHANTVTCQLFSWSQAHMIFRDKIRDITWPLIVTLRERKLSSILGTNWTSVNASSVVAPYYTCGASVANTFSSKSFSSSQRRRKTKHLGTCRRFQHTMNHARV